ncbi:MAG: AmmeMemoRadiSam system protein B [Candidatus Babeliales bacterium]
MKRFLVAILLVFIIELPTSSVFHEAFFTSHLSNQWYPQDHTHLKQLIQQLDTQATQNYGFNGAFLEPLALIVPHAAYTYSGAVATSAYRLLNQKTISQIILLAPYHKGIKGCIFPSFTRYKTALGTCTIGTLDPSIQSLPFCSSQDEPFKQEHAIEIQLPLIQTYFPKATVIPLLVGALNDREITQLANALRPYSKNSLFIISSDFTHYGARFSYTPFTDMVIERIKKHDNKTIREIMNLNPVTFKQALVSSDANICGAKPLRILLELLKNEPLVQPYLIAYDTSNTQTHTTDTVVSYASIIFNKESQNSPYRLTNYEEQMLHKTSYETLYNHFYATHSDESLLQPFSTPRLSEKRGLFVTLYHKGKLRGCIGTVTPTAPLYESIIQITKSAAFNDPRFPPLQKTELKDLSIHISILTPSSPITSYKNIQLGKDGIILTYKQHSALFLPQVAQEQHWTLKETLQALARKAHLPPDIPYTHPDVTFSVFQSYNILPLKENKSHAKH